MKVLTTCNLKTCHSFNEFSINWFTSLSSIKAVHLSYVRRDNATSSKPAPSDTKSKWSSSGTPPPLPHPTPLRPPMNK